MLQDLHAHLARYNQSHLLNHWDQLDDRTKKCLADQIQAIDLDQLDRLIRGQSIGEDWSRLAEQAQSPPAVRVGLPHPECSLEQARMEGESAIRAGRIATILVAGGQGTRLGFDQPKGMFPIGPLSHRTLFEMHVHRLQGMMRRYRISIPLFVMTSPMTDAATREYFDKNHRFGLTESELTIFCQGTMPAIDSASGRILLSDPGNIASSPDGHGGLVSALQQNGILERAAAQGIETFFYAQVDNPLVQLGDPVLLGYHLRLQSDMTTQVVQKRFAKEKVGNVVQIEGRVHIIEYSDLPDEVGQRVQADGSLQLWAGNIAVHCMQRKFLHDISSSVAGLPFHRAHKVVPTLDASGNRIHPDAPNAIKFERFIFDLLPLAKNPLVVEGLAEDIFAPVKNAEGAATDTPHHARQAISRLHKKWLLQSGATVCEGVEVEIHPDWALDATEVSEKIQPSLDIRSDTYFLC